MGQTLSQPVTEKHTTVGADDRHLFGVSEMQGWRIGMEDAHAAVLRLAPDDPNAFFAVYDGHGGSSVARFAGRHVHERLLREEAYGERDFPRALKQAFLGTDEDMRADPAFAHDPAGCTAVAALVTDSAVFVANAGDSRSVLSSGGTAKPLSFDHKPQNELETKRIRAAGGYIEFGRVNGNLSLSRALGDFEFKKNYTLAPERQVITADPDVTEHTLTEEDEFVVLACDGIWDCLSSQQVVNIVRRQIAEGAELGAICELVIDRCLAPDSGIQGGIGCDNMTLLIVALLGGRDKQSWYDWVRDRVEAGVGYPTPAGLPDLYPQHRGGAPLRPNGGFRGLGGGFAFYPAVGVAPPGFAPYDDAEYDDSSEEDGEEEEGEDEPHQPLSASIEEVEDDEDAGGEDDEDEEDEEAAVAAAAATAAAAAARDRAADNAVPLKVQVAPAATAARVPTVVDGHVDDDTPIAGDVLAAPGVSAVVGSPLVPSPEPLAALVGRRPSPAPPG